MNSSLEDRLISYYEQLTAELPAEGPGLDAVPSATSRPSAMRRPRTVGTIVLIGSAAAALALGLVYISQRPAETHVGPSATQEPTGTTVRSTEPSTPATGSSSPIAATDDAPDIAKGTLFGLAPLTAASPDVAIALLRPSLGEVTWDTDWQPMPAEFACTGNDSYRTIWWADVRMTFERGTVGTLLTAWSVGTAQMLAPLGPPPSTTSPATGIGTAEGIRIGSTVSDVIERFPGHRYDDISQSIQIQSSTGLATMLYFDGGDQLVGFGSSRNDCGSGF